MNAQAVLEQARELGITVQTDGIDLIYWPKTSAPAEFVETMGANKASLVEYLNRYRHLYREDVAGTTELQEIERRVEEKGYVLLRSTLLDDFVAFYKTEADRGRIPAGFVPYSDRELQTLFREDDPEWSEERLWRTHMAKKIAGFTVTNVHDD